MNICRQWAGITLACSFVSAAAFAQSGWTVQTVGSTHWNVSCVSANTCMATDDQGILRTDDGGNTWVSQSVGFGTLYGIYFIDENTGYVSGSSGVVAKTLDGGGTWNQLKVPTGEILNSIACSSDAPIA